MLAYHATNVRFDSFDPARRELGFHFGSRQSALARFADKFSEGQERVLVVAEITLTNPLRLVSDLGDWSDLESLQEYLGPDNFEIFTEAETQAWASAEDVRLALQAKGFDGVEYTNSFEPSSEPSFVVFESEQIAIVATL